jgi:hypothetical protein
LKDLLLSILLTRSSIDKPMLSVDLFRLVNPNLSLRSFQRSISDIINEYNQKTYEKVIRGQISKDSAVLILSDKSRGYFAAGTKEARKEGVLEYFSTVKTELAKARFLNKFVNEVDNLRLQQDFEFLREENNGELFG